MSKSSRKLKPGDWALTDWLGGTTRVQISARKAVIYSQSGIMFQTVPPLEENDPRAWYDADWFEPAPQSVARDGREG